MPRVDLLKPAHGPLPPADTRLFLPSQASASSLNPVKARRLLQILLALGKSADEVKQAFEGELESFLTLDLKKYY